MHTIIFIPCYLFHFLFLIDLLFVSPKLPSPYFNTILYFVVLYRFPHLWLTHNCNGNVVSTRQNLIAISLSLRLLWYIYAPRAKQTSARSLSVHIFFFPLHCLWILSEFWLFWKTSLLHNSLCLFIFLIVWWNSIIYVILFK